jgi:predicted ATPase/transcriptional regulator with XRE-family HTH domain
LRQSPEIRAEPGPLPWNELLRALRLAAGVTQEGWAAQLGYGRRTVQRWEHGTAAPDEAAAGELIALCAAKGLFRTFGRWPLAGSSLDAESLAAALAEARLATAHPAMVGTSELVPSPGRLPDERDPLIGRTWEVEELARLVVATRLVTLTGAGGVGKTRLAVRVGHRVGASFVDRARFVELADVTDPAIVPLAIARAVGVRDVPGRSLADRLVVAVGGRRLLLVLDNCEQVRDAVAAFVAELIRGATVVHVLATSRERLGLSAELVWSLAPLITPAETGVATPAAIAESDAVALFVERARRSRPGFELTADNAADVARLCRRLDGLPLAIELAAARVGFLTPAELETHLRTRLDLLASSDPSAPARHRTVTAALDWAWSLLSDDERDVFARSAVFVDAFTLEALAAVTEHDVLPVLGRLVGLSLIIGRPDLSAQRTRYRLLETVRTYAADRLAVSGAAGDAEARLGRWCVTMAAAAGRGIHGPDQARWFRWVDEEHSAIRSVMLRALDAQDAATACRLIASLSWTWGALGRLTEGRAWADRASRSAPPETPGRTATLIASATYASFAGDRSAARSWLDEADRAARATDDRAGKLVILGLRARHAQAAGDFEAAGKLAGEVLGHPDADRWTRARMLEVQSHAALRSGRADVAQSSLEEGLELARADGDVWGIATNLAELGDLARSLDEHQRARELYEEAILLREQIGIPGSTPSLHQNLGFVALASGDATTAADRFRHAFDEFRRSGDDRGMAESAIGLAGVAVHERRWSDAARLLGWADRVLAKVGAEVWPANRGDRDRIVLAAMDALGDAGWRRERARGEMTPPP